MDASWRRLEVPAGTAHWIARLDDQGPTVIRSPWALEAWCREGYSGLDNCISPARPGTFTKDRALPMWIHPAPKPGRRFSIIPSGLLI